MERVRGRIRRMTDRQTDRQRECKRKYVKIAERECKWENEEYKKGGG